MSLISIAYTWHAPAWSAKKDSRPVPAPRSTTTLAGLHGALDRLAAGIAASPVQEQALLQDRAAKFLHHRRLLEQTALEPAVELLGKGHKRCSAPAAARRLRRRSGM